MIIRNSNLSAIVVVAIVVLIVGAVLGLELSDSELLNPITGEAERNRMEVETAHLAEVYWLEEQRQAQVNELELGHQRQKLELERAFLSIRNSVLIGAAAVGLVIVSIGVAILLAKLGDRWSVQAQQAAVVAPGPSEDVWKARAYRDARIRMARENERLLREARLREAHPAVSNNGRDKEPVLNRVR
jgi:hypothetical protein